MINIGFDTLGYMMTELNKPDQTMTSLRDPGIEQFLFIDPKIKQYWHHTDQEIAENTLLWYQPMLAIDRHKVKISFQKNKAIMKTFTVYYRVKPQEKIYYIKEQFLPLFNDNGQLICYIQLTSLLSMHAWMTEKEFNQETNEQNPENPLAKLLTENRSELMSLKNLLDNDSPRKKEFYQIQFQGKKSDIESSRIPSLLLFAARIHSQGNG